jgi:hypothetical protein
VNFTAIAIIQRQKGNGAARRSHKAFLPKAKMHHPTNATQMNGEYTIKIAGVSDVVLSAIALPMIISGTAANKKEV